MYEKLRKLNLKRRFSLRTALMASLTLALLVLATVFMTVSASDDVTPSDVSPTSASASYRIGGHSRKVSPTDVSASDGIMGVNNVSPIDTCSDPETLGEPVITMTTAKNNGEELNLSITGESVYVDYGDGAPVEYPGDMTVKGQNIKIYGNSITYLSCDNNQLTSLDLSNDAQLETVYCYNNLLTSLEVPKGSALKMLSCGLNNLTSLDISGCTALETLADYGNPIATLNASGCSSLKKVEEFKEDGNGTLTSLNVAGCTSVEQIYINNNPLTALDISDCIALKSLYCHTNQLETLDVTHNPNLEVLSCPWNNLKELDLSQNTKLTALFCHENQLTDLDLANNIALENVSCGSNPLETLDVTNNVALKYLQCDVNDLSELDVTQNTNLEYLDFVVNNISSIDLSKNTKLETLRAGGNNLTSLNLSKNTALKHVECDVNKMPFSGFIGFSDYNEFLYAPQSEYQIPSSVAVGESIDLSSEYSYNGTVSQFTWYDEEGNVIVPATANGGVFTFGEDAAGKTLVCKMTNAKLPDFKADADEIVGWDDENQQDIYGKVDHRLTTTPVTVLAPLGEPVITMTTAKAVGESLEGMLSFEIAGNNVFVDYGDGFPVSYPGDKIVKGSNIKIYGDNITELYLCEDKLTSLDLSKAASLFNVWCDNNQLTSINVSGCSALEHLFCSNNKLASIDVSGCPALTQLYCDYNQLTSLDVSACPALTDFDCTNNQLTSLVVSNNTADILLSCSNNRLAMPLLYGLMRYGFNADLEEYAPQTHIIPATVKAGENIDLSSEYSVDGTASEFVWYDSDENVITPATANGGVFTFGDDAVGKTLVCKMTNAKLPDFKADEDGNDNRLFTTEVAIEAKDPEEPVSSDDSVSSQENEDVQGDPVIYYDLAFKQDENVDGVSEVLYPERTMISINGMGVDLHSVKGVHLTVGNIETNTKKTVLDAIKHYNETFDTETTDIALYDISLEDKNNVHVKVVAGEILVCLKYPDNLARQSEDYVFHLYHQKADGTIEEIPVTIRRNGIWFRATDFSPYVLYWHVKTVESAGTGESFALIIVMTVLCALSVAGAGYALYRRKKLTAE